MSGVHAGGRGEAGDFECVETGIRARHGPACGEFSGVRADTPGADRADAGRIPGGAGGADGEPVVEAWAQDKVESADESRGDVIAAREADPMEFKRRLAGSNPRWGAITNELSA